MRPSSPHRRTCISVRTNAPGAEVALKTSLNGYARTAAESLSNDPRGSGTNERPELTVHAVIFDIDGTLLHSAAVDDALYREAVRVVLGEVRLRPSLHEYDYITDTGVLSQILADNEISSTRDYEREVRKCFVEFLRGHVESNGPFVEIPGARDILKSLRESASHAVAIATGGWRESAELKLQSAGLDYSDFPLASANDHHERTGIMNVALSQLSGSFESVTYYGDGPWDRRACDELGWKFVPVGPALGGIESYIGHRLLELE